MHIRSISEVFTDFQSSLSRPEVTVADILEALHERGFGFLLLVFSLPAMIPIPGISAVLAAPLIFLTSQQALGRHTVWIPENVKNKGVAKDQLNRLLNMVLPWLKRLEFIFQPRLSFATQGIFSNITGILGVIMSLTIMIPLPLTNTVPGFGISLMAIGIIMRDGLAVLAGAAIGTTWVFLLFFAAIFFGAEGFDMLKETIKSYL